MLHFPVGDMLAGNDESSAESVISNSALMAGPGRLFVFIQSYFDESYNDDLLCVAGYSFTARNARLLDNEWRKMLLRHGKLPYFRMSLCNARKPPFDALDEQQCVALASEAIALVKRYALVGYAITVDKKAFARAMPKNKYFRTPYELCAWFCLIGSRTEVPQVAPDATGMEFFFESGFQHESSANAMMQRIFRDKAIKERSGYKGHHFVDKIESRPTQAADLLAWQWYKDCTRRAKGHTAPRGDLRELLDGLPHQVLHLEEAKIAEIAKRLESLL